MGSIAALAFVLLGLFCVFYPAVILSAAKDLCVFRPLRSLCFRILSFRSLRILRILGG